MKKTGILNAQLARVVASMGHRDRLVIGDGGLPLPRHHEVVDLALTTNVPRFEETLRVVLEELAVEAVVVAEEMERHSPDVLRTVRALLPDARLTTVPHETFKAMTHEDETVACVRTGEATPYANVILVAGVTFG